MNSSQIQMDKFLGALKKISCILLLSLSIFICSCSSHISGIYFRNSGLINEKLSLYRDSSYLMECVGDLYYVFSYGSWSLIGHKKIMLTDSFYCNPLYKIAISGKENFDSSVNGIFISLNGNIGHKEIPRMHKAKLYFSKIVFNNDSTTARDLSVSDTLFSCIKPGTIQSIKISNVNMITQEYIVKDSKSNTFYLSINSSGGLNLNNRVMHKRNRKLYLDSFAFEKSPNFLKRTFKRRHPKVIPDIGVSRVKFKQKRR